MNRQSLLLYLSVFGVGVGAFQMACQALTRYPDESPGGPYQAGLQGGEIAGGGGSTEDVITCFGDGPCIGPEGGLPEGSTPTPPACVGSGCSVVAYASSPQSIALDTANVYWTDQNGSPWFGEPAIGTVTGDIKSAVRAGGSGVASTVASSVDGPFVIRQNSGWLAWTNYFGAGAGMSSVQTLQIGSSGSPATPGASQWDANGVALDGTNVYWAEADVTMVNDAVILSAPLAGGAVTTVATISTGGTGFVPEGIVKSATDVYVAGWGTLDGYIYDATLGVPVAVAIWTGAGHATDLAGDSKNLYWTDSPAGSVYEMAIGGTTPTTIATGMKQPLSIAVDSSNVYFSTQDGVYESPIGGTAHMLVAQTLVTGVAADDNDSSVYFAYDLAGAGAILTTPK